MSLHYMKLFKTGKLKNETIVELFDFHHIQLKVNQKLVYFILFVVLLSLIILRAYSTAIAVCLKFIQRLPFFFHVGTTHEIDAHKYNKKKKMVNLSNLFTDIFIRLCIPFQRKSSD